MGIDGLPPSTSLHIMDMVIDVAAFWTLNLSFNF